LVCIALRRIGDSDEGVRRAIANKVIDLAKTGERNPDVLCERVLKQIHDGGDADLNENSATGAPPSL
jgi:hypothetical protein